ncbi:hypothetical protein L3Q82_004049 [Scortum barcoo]|uniref:Uncharacterized protein n=1 Tax=Scortum barcoo TaxID=214431 RepID=A0ACB8X707_9TELE|nr:hypothetical protein L3Q82_004049 [Scortum barcoo]
MEDFHSLVSATCTAAADQCRGKGTSCRGVSKKTQAAGKPAVSKGRPEVRAVGVWKPEPDVAYDRPRPRICVETNTRLSSTSSPASKLHDGYETRHAPRFRTRSYSSSPGNKLQI